MRDRVTDPEILADQHRRARVAGGHDRELEAEPVRPFGAFGPVVAGWACRARCGRFVPVDDAAIAALANANATLRRRGEPELGVHEIVFCPACKHRAAPDRADALRRSSEEMGRLIVELKSLVDNDLRERSIVARLRELHHPDVDALLRAVRESRATKNTTTKRRTT